MEVEGKGALQLVEVPLLKINRSGQRVFFSKD
jgi:hypothetical protein